MVPDEHLLHSRREDGAITLSTLPLLNRQLIASNALNQRRCTHLWRLLDTNHHSSVLTGVSNRNGMSPVVLFTCSIFGTYLYALFLNTSSEHWPIVHD